MKDPALIRRPAAAALPLVRALHVPAWPDARPPLLGFSLVAAVAASDGGYWPTAWGWTALALCWLAILALVLRDRFRIGLFEGAMILGLVAVLESTVVSLAWTSSVGRTVLEAERTIAYISALLATMLLVRSRSYRHLLGGIWAGIWLVSAYALATRLFPERLGVFDPVAGYRLSEPLGYWNALGVFAALGTLLALGLASRARSLLVRSLAAASVLILLPTLYFTFSRGGWIALGVGLVAAAALDSRRLQFLGTVLALTPAPALGIALASRSDALTRLDASLTAASREGHRLALVLAVLAVANALVVRRLDLVARRVSISAGMRRAIALALVAAVVVAAAAVLVRYGGPASAPRRAYDAFAAPFPATGRDLNQRLFTFSGGERVSLWDAAWTDFEEHGLRGSGAGTYEFYWLRHREKAFKVRDAHSLYLETLAEIGPLGLAVLLATLAIPAAAAIRTRSHSLVPVAFGAYVAYLAHAGFDWDWEMSAITLTALLTGAAPLAVARERAFAQPSRLFRLAMTAGALVLAAFAFVGVIGNSAVAAAREAAESGRWADSERHARKAMDWMPWSSEPWQLAGEAQLARRRPVPATKTLRTAISKDSQNWELWADLAVASRGRARRAAALRALRLNPLGPELAGLRRQFGSEE